MRHNRYWTGPPPPPDPKNCKHRNMSFTVIETFIDIHCMDCGTHATAPLREISTDQAQAALNRARDIHIQPLSSEEWEKIWR